MRYILLFILSFWAIADETDLIDEHTSHCHYGDKDSCFLIAEIYQEEDRGLAEHYYHEAKDNQCLCPQTCNRSGWIEYQLGHASKALEYYLRTIDLIELNRAHTHPKYYFNEKENMNLAIKMIKQLGHH